MAEPVGATPPMFGGDEWTWLLPFRQEREMAEGSSTQRRAHSATYGSEFARGKRRESKLVREKLNWLRRNNHTLAHRWGGKKVSVAFRKIFLDSRQHFEDDQITPAPRDIWCGCRRATNKNPGTGVMWPETIA
jgi:hypothetical protein